MVLSEYFFSVLMLALVDANYKFLYVDVGAPGRAGDAGVFSDCTLKKALFSDTLKLPPPSAVSTGFPLPYHIIGDDAFTMAPNLMKPYPQRYLDRQKKINYRCSRARRTVENAFGILANRFRLFLTTINLDPDKVVWLILASCALHNFLVEKDKAGYLNADSENAMNGNVQPGQWREDKELSDMQPSLGRNPSQRAKQQRDELAEYFMSDHGSVPWQDSMVAIPTVQNP